jgi:hypothetical protein
MDPICIVVDGEVAELSRQVGYVPEECAVKQLAANRANQALNEWMGNGRKGYRLDLLDFPNTQVRQPAVKTEQGVVIGTDAPGHRSPCDGTVEQAADPNSVDRSSFHGAADETTSENVDHDHHLVTAQEDRFAAQQVNTPKAILGMRENHQPRWPSAPWKGAILQWVRIPPGKLSLQPVVIGAAVEVTKRLKPSV